MECSSLVFDRVPFRQKVINEDLVGKADHEHYVVTRCSYLEYLLSLGLGFERFYSFPEQSRWFLVCSY